MKRTAALLLTLGLALSAHAQTAVSTHGQLRVSGNQIQNRNNQAVQLRGMSLFWSNWYQEGRQFWNRSVVKWLVDDWKIQVIRAPIGVPQDGITSYNNTSAAARAALDSVIQAAIDYGIYVVVDWHSHNIENQYRDAARTLMASVAQRWGNHPNIIYEIFNEPLNVSWGQLRDYANNIIPAIRAHDNNNIIVVGTPNWSQDVDQVGSNRPSGSNIAYALHFYAGTHFDDLRNKGNQARSAGNAIFVTEWGTTNADGNGGVNTGASDTWLNWMQQNNIPWCNWAVSWKNESSAIFNYVAPMPARYPVGGWTSSDLSTSGRYVRGKLRSAAGFNANTYDTPAPPMPSSSSGTGTEISSTSGPGIVSGVPSIIRADGFSMEYGTRVETNRDDGIGQQVAYINDGDWIEYLVNNANVPRAQWHVRVAGNNSTPSTITMKINGVTVGTRTVTSTGGWADYSSLIAPDSVSLPLGEFTLRLEFSSSSTAGLFNLSWFALLGDAVLVPTLRGGLITSHQPKAHWEAGNLMVTLPSGHAWERGLVHDSRGRLVGKFNAMPGLSRHPVPVNTQNGTLFVTMEGQHGTSSQTISIAP